VRYNQEMSNPLLCLNYETAIESLGGDYLNEVAAADIPQDILGFRNEKVLPKLGLAPAQVTDEHFIEAFGKFHCVRPSSRKFISGLISESSSCHCAMIYNS
jgi:uncharacterized protein YdiU (UPF0061 family)